MASVIWILYVVLYAEFMCAVSADKLLSLDCQDENHGVHGKDSLLKCFLNSRGESVRVISATWRRPGRKRPLIKFPNDNGTVPEHPRFSFKQLQMSGSNIDVSFLVRNTVRTDEGKYECEVVTDSGEDTAVVSLSVTEGVMGDQGSTGSTASTGSMSSTASTAVLVFVIVGSLLCGLLILALLHRRRIQRAMYPEGSDMMEEGNAADNNLFLFNKFGRFEQKRINGYNSISKHVKLDYCPFGIVCNPYSNKSLQILGKWRIFTFPFCVTEL